MMKMILALLAMTAVAFSAVAAPQQSGDAARQAASSQFANKGTVLEVIDTSMYTYLQVDGGSGPVWIAAPRMEVAKGDTVGYPSGMVMSNFHSKSLNRTFPSIIFVEQVAVVKK
jgi:hypothetical protein